MEEGTAIVGLLVLSLAFVATLVSLVSHPRTALRYLALGLVLVILWAAMPALGVTH